MADFIPYYAARRGSGDALIMLHGFTGRGASWASIASELERGWAVILPDIIGHGSSPTPGHAASYIMEQAARSIIALAEEPFHLLGYSMGGRLALYIAANYPRHIRSLVLENASPGLRTAEERSQRTAADSMLAAQIEEKGIAWFVDYWENLALWESQKALPDSERARLHQQRLANNAQGLANSLRGMGTGAMPPLWDALETLTMPVQLIAGSLDKKFAALNSEMARMIPHAQLDIVVSAGHTVHLEQPALYTQIVTAFLRHHS